MSEVRGVINSSLTPQHDFLRLYGDSCPFGDLYPSPLCTPSIYQTSGNMSKAIIGSCNINSFNTTITDDRNHVLQWLSLLEPQKRHQHLRGNRLKGVGEWIFRTDEFRRWDTREDGSPHSVLFCHGDPGVGKTHLR